MKTEKEIREHLRKFLVGEIDMEQYVASGGFHRGWHDALEWVLEDSENLESKARD